MSGSRGNGSDLPSEQCHAFAPSLAAFVEGALPPEEASRIAAHVAGCGWCAQRVAAYTEVETLIRAAPRPTPPASLRAGLYARIAAEASSAAPRHRPSEVESIVRETNTANRPTASPSPLSPHRPGPTALARWLGPLAAVLIVALLAGVLTTRGQRRTGPGPTAKPSPTVAPQPACPSSQVRATLPARTFLGDLVMTSPGTGWAVGGAADGSTANTTYHTVILRLSHCQWAPIGTSYPNAQLGAIAMVSAGEGWATGTQANKPLLLHYKDGAWSRVTPPPLGDIYQLGVVRALPNGDVWVAGQTPAGIRASSGIALLHLAGGKWSRIETSLSEVSDIGPTGPGDAWLIGRGFPTNNVAGLELAHVRGNAVTQEVTLDPRDTLTHLRMLAPNDGWALGIAYVSGNETNTDPTVTRPLALHYDGSRWTEADTGVSPHARAIDVLGPGVAWAYTTAIPQANGPEFIVSTQRENAGKWANVPWPYKDMQSFSRLTCVTPDDCWAIGAYLLPPARQTMGDGSTVIMRGFGTLLLRYAGGAWHEYGHG
ncbi:MAG TPA: zf-HC2 domain-containing protein [Ktedonobacterales bacterium]